MDKQILVVILGMAVVTYIPRALPALFIDKIELGPRVEKFLRLIPYTAMAALIFPGILSTDSSEPVIGLAGGLAAVLLAYRRLPVMVCVIGAIAVDMLIYMII